MPEDNFEKAKKDLEDKKVKSKCKEYRLEGAIELLESKLDVVRRKVEELRGRRLSLEAKVKPLLKEGRIEEAEIWIPEITQLENSEKYCIDLIRIITRIIQRIKIALIWVDVIDILKNKIQNTTDDIDIQITKRGFEVIKKLKDELENALKDLNILQKALNSASSTMSDVLSGILTKDELKILERLIKESIKEIENAEDLFKGL